jgi:hypothetical protein
VECILIKPLITKLGILQYQVVVAKTQTNYTQTRRQSNLDQDRRRNLKLGRLQVQRSGNDDDVSTYCTSDTVNSDSLTSTLVLPVVERLPQTPYGTLISCPLFATSAKTNYLS